MKCQLTAYKALLQAARDKAGASSSAFSSAVEAFEIRFFNLIVVIVCNYRRLCGEGAARSTRGKPTAKKEFLLCLNRLNKPFASLI